MTPSKTGTKKRTPRRGTKCCNIISHFWGNLDDYILNLLSQAYVTKWQEGSGNDTEVIKDVKFRYREDAKAIIKCNKARCKYNTLKKYEQRVKNLYRSRPLNKV